MARTRIKICGITRPEDAKIAVAAGVDAIGLVFWAPSSRSVSIAAAEQICQQIPAFVSVVALTVDAQPQWIEQLLQALPISLLQFHGKEPPEYCQQFNHPYMKAIRMRPELDLAIEIERFDSAQSLLLDAYQPGVPGGTGERFDWQRIDTKFRSSIVLAGGLNPGNVAQAVTTVQPYAVDVSGGVEAAKGIKDPQKMAQFVRAVQRVDGQ